MARKHQTLTDLFSAIAGAIRSKTNGTEQIVADDFPDAISSISTGIELPALTNPAAEEQILEGYEAVDGAGKKMTGNIPSKSANDMIVSGATVTASAGYYPAQTSKSVETATQATPSISVSSAGLITASATQEAGYVIAGEKSATEQLATQGAQTITPGTADKTISSGRYLTGALTIKGDANLVAENIVSGKSIFGVSGTAQTAQIASIDCNNQSSDKAWIYSVGPDGSDGVITMMANDESVVTASCLVNSMIAVRHDNVVTDVQTSGLTLIKGVRGSGDYYIRFYSVDSSGVIVIVDI